MEKRVFIFIDNNKRLIDVLSDHFSFLKEKYFYTSCIQAETKINKLLKKKSRSTCFLIVDYSMPIMNGIEFCGKFLEGNVVKILYSNIVKDDEVNMAIADGAIHKFIEKGAPNSISTLEECMLNYSAC